MNVLLFRAQEFHILKLVCCIWKYLMWLIKEEQTCYVQYNSYVLVLCSSHPLSGSCVIWAKSPQPFFWVTSLEMHAVIIYKIWMSVCFPASFYLKQGKHSGLTLRWHTAQIKPPGSRIQCSSTVSVLFRAFRCRLNLTALLLWHIFMLNGRW